MATNLLIGSPTIPFNTSIISISGASEDPAQSLTNLVAGGRGAAFQTLAAAGVTDVIFDLGASTTKAAEFFFIACAKVLKQQGSTQALLSSSPDNVTYTSRLGTTTGFLTKTFSGPQGDDLICAVGYNDDIGGSLPTSAFRYWRFRFGVASPTKKWMIRKLYCGTFFDFGKDPERPTFELSRGVRTLNDREPAIRFSLTWKGITNTLRQSFISTIYRFRDVMPVVLYDTNDKLFDGWHTVHCTILSGKWTRRTALTCDLTLEFEEQV
jgi:hypothetical protein